MKNERKEELKDKMKNRISLALKDPILQQGFEIICKENAELKHQLEHRNCLDCSNHSSNLRMRNLDLEKANAELKKQLEMSNKVYNDNFDYSHHIEGQLTHAKEIIKKFSEFANLEVEYDPEHPQEHTDLWNKLCEETEQFLNCSEKPNN